MSYQFTPVYSLPILNPEFGIYLNVACNGNSKYIFVVEISQSSSSTNKSVVHRSGDSGVTWESVLTVDDYGYIYVGSNIGVSTSGKYVIFNSNTHVYFSTNSGTNFTITKPDILDEYNINNCALGSVIKGVQQIFISVSVLSEPQSFSYIYKSSNNGKTWNKILKVLLNEFVDIPILTASLNSSYVYVMVKGKLYISSDNGKTFEQNDINTGESFFEPKCSGNGRYVLLTGNEVTNFNTLNIAFKNSPFKNKLLKNKLLKNKPLKNKPLKAEVLNTFILSTDFGKTFNPLKDTYGNLIDTYPSPYIQSSIDINGLKILTLGLIPDDSESHIDVYLGTDRNANNFSTIYTIRESFIAGIATNNQQDENSKIIISASGMVQIGIKNLD